MLNHSLSRSKLDPMLSFQQAAKVSLTMDVRAKVINSRGRPNIKLYKEYM